MGSLSDLNTPANVQPEKDVVGGGGGYLFETGIHDVIIKMAYVSTADSGAMAINVDLEGDKSIQEALWVRSGNVKGNKTTYTAQNGEERALPGYLLADSLCKLAAGKPLSQMNTEAKTIQVTRFGETNTLEAEVLTELIGKPVKAAIFKQRENKQAKDANGNYAPINEPREVNVLEKFISATDGRTVAEVESGMQAEFAQKWADRWTGEVRDRFKAVADNTGTAGAPAAANNSGSLFG